MKRVASLYLPNWSIDRLRRAERTHALPPEAPSISLLPLKTAGDAEHAVQCDAPRNSGWRPGARWAKVDHDVAARIAALPTHQRPPLRELGRRSEAAEMPFKRLPGDDGGKSSGWTAPRQAVPRRDPAVALGAWNQMPAVRYPGDGPQPDKHARSAARGGSNDPHSAPPAVAAFFDTARSTADTLARVCPAHAVPRANRNVARPDDCLLVTVHKIDSRVEIATASPTAQAIGILSGMALTQARAAVPELDVRNADLAGDRAALERLAIALARRWCPVVAISDDDGLLLDLTGVAHLHGGEQAMALRIVRVLARLGFTARIAVTDTAGAAWALARHGRRPDDSAGCVAVFERGKHLTALAPLPVTALRLAGSATELLARLGIATIGDLLTLPRAPLVRRFGKAIAQRLDQATGAVGEPLDPVIPSEPIAVVRRFAEPIATAESIGHWLGGLVEQLTVELVKAGHGARVLLFVAERVDATAQTIRIGFARPTRDAPHILRLIVRRIVEIDPGYGIDVLALHVRRADPLCAEALGAALAGEQAPDLAPLVDALANRIGPARVWRSRAIESDVPERSFAPLPPLDPPERDTIRSKVDDIRQLDMRALDHPWHPRWPRPVRLLYRPERIDHVLAELPDQPPRRFTWRGRRHIVIRADGPERITGEWWRCAAERSAVRDYFQVEDESGRRFWLFRRGDGIQPETGDLSWYLHGTFG